MLQGRWLQDDDDKGESALSSLEYWLVLYLQEKEKEGAYDAPPLSIGWFCTYKKKRRKVPTMPLP